MKIVVVKSLVLGGLFCMTFLSSMLPVKLLAAVNDSSHRERRRKYQRVISFLSCFAAGVFLATCLLDLFPDVQDKLYTTLDKMGIITGYPVAEFITVLGIFIILIIEQIVLTVKENHAHNQMIERGEDEERRGLLAKPPTSPCQRPYRSISDISGEYRVVNTDNSVESIGYNNESEIEESHEHEHHDPSSHSFIRSVMLIMALSIHSIFEGLAVGLQPTAQATLQIFIALILHKCVLAFSLGMNLMQSKLTTWGVIRSNLAFSLASPTGIAIGMLIIDVSDSLAASLVNGILQGIACGTFLYVTFFEVLPHEFNSQQDRLLKLLFLLIGYSSVAGILFLDPDVIRQKKIHGGP
ncbi:unnamed protein product [Owenia fusiformis]|uniref:Uncharacterized protein n=1 Tax=Owenia fusiformis TaxID=6347 RepID=A0A8J1XSQ0_OWEFU|nr:unnamed protein product [Owenia fusiformis]